MNATESGAAADLQEWIDRLSEAARVGELLNVAGSGPVDAANAQSWGPDRCIPAAALRHVFTSRDFSVDPRGLRISGARFREELDFAHIAFQHPLHLMSCALDAAIDLSGAVVKELSLEGSHTHRVNLDNAQITGGVFANRLEAYGEVCAVGVHIDGQLSLNDVKLRNGDAVRRRADPRRRSDYRRRVR